MTDENDLLVASQLGEIRATLKAIEYRLDDIGSYHHDYEHRITSIEKLIIGFKAKVGIVAGLVSFGITFIGWVILHWSKIMKAFS